MVIFLVPYISSSPCPREREGKAVIRGAFTLNFCTTLSRETNRTGAQRQGDIQGPVRRVPRDLISQLTPSVGSTGD